MTTDVSRSEDKASTPAFDPTRAPLIDLSQGTGELVLPASRLDGGWVRQRFLNPPEIWTPESISGFIHATPKPDELGRSGLIQPSPRSDGSVFVPSHAGAHQRAAQPMPGSVVVSAGRAATSGPGEGVPVRTWGPSGAPLRAEPIPAAVLVPLIPCEDGLGVLLTVRSHLLRKHRGQIAFPGGRIDADDASPEEAALREAHEEIGLAREWVDILGSLPWLETGTGFRVRPVVGMLHESVQPAQLALAEAEVAELFVVPLSYLMNPGHHQRRLASWQQGAERMHRAFYAMPWRNPAGREYFIWGATAFMLRNLYRFLAAD